MKSSKKLMIVLLVLAIVTALSAGTLAIYTSTLDNAVGTTNITAKTFAFEHTDNFTDKIAFEMAPGESSREGQIPTYELTNVNKQGQASEVPMDVTLTPSYTDFFTTYRDVDVKLVVTKADGSVIAERDWNAANLPAAVEMKGVFEAGVPTTITCKLTYSWIASDTDSAEKNARDLAAMAAAKDAPKEITMSFGAVQAI